MTDMYEISINIIEQTHADKEKSNKNKMEKKEQTHFIWSFTVLLVMTTFDANAKSQRWSGEMTQGVETLPKETDFKPVSHLVKGECQFLLFPK